VSLKIGELIEIAKADLKIQSLLNSGWFFASIFVMSERNQEPKDYRLILYNPESNEVQDCVIKTAADAVNLKDHKVSVGEKSEARSELAPLIIDNHLELDDVLEIANRAFSESDLLTSISAYLASFHTKGGKITWTVNIIYQGLRVRTFEIDANTGEILRDETTTLMKK